jgi:hypothetical protein
MPNDDERRVSEKLERLAHLEAIVQHGIRSLQERVAAIVARLSFHEDPERGLMAGDQANGVTVYFRSRSLLYFEVQPGHVPTGKPVLARCEIRPARSEHVMAVLHLVKTNGHGEWELFDGQRSQRLEDSTLTKVIESEADDALKLYGE